MSIDIEEAKELLEAPIKELTIEEGFHRYKMYLNKPLECSTTLNTEGFPLRKLYGFVVESKDENFILTDEILRELYMKFLKGDEGDYETF